LVETDEGPVLVETGPHSTIDQLKAGVAETGHAITEIRHVLLTHIHLDHAGAAWTLAEHGAKIYAHPFGAKHLVSPDRLIASATLIYGAEMDRLWGKMEPIPEAQVVPVLHEQLFRIGGRDFAGFHTPGHARHHIAWQLGQDSVFTGDVAGIKVGDGPVQPPCPPPDVDLQDWRKSVQLLRRLTARQMFLTHFGEVGNKEAHLDELMATLADWSEWIRLEMRDGQIVQDMMPAFQRYVERQIRERGGDDAMVARYDAANPVDMSVTGLVRYWTKLAQEDAP